MSIESRKRFTRKILIVSSAIILSLGIFSQLSSFVLAKDDEISGKKEVLGTEVVRMIPDDPRVTSIFKPRQVSIHHMGKIYSGVTYARTVEEAIDDFDIPLTENSVITPDPALILGMQTSIRVDEIVKERQVEYAYIEYQTIEQEDDTVEWGVETIVQPGITGQKKLTWEYLYLNNVYKGRNLVEEEIVMPSQEEIISIGTKKVYREITVSNFYTGTETFNYWRVIESMKVTRYQRYCDGCSGYTYTGELLEKGMVAVDPSVIPLGTHLYIPGYGYAVANDTGGGVKGNHIDLGFDKISNWYGKVSPENFANVYFLD